MEITVLYGTIWYRIGKTSTEYDTGQDWTVWSMTGKDRIRQDRTETCRTAMIEQDD